METTNSTTAGCNDLHTSHGCDLGSFNVASNKGWGLQPGVGGLRGGGHNSLNNNNGTSGWGAPPSAAAANATGWGAPPGSTSSIATAGGGGSTTQNVTSGNSGSSLVVGPTLSSSSTPSSLVQTPTNTGQIPTNHSASNQWGGGGGGQAGGSSMSSPNRNTSQQNNNGQTTISGSQMNNNPHTNPINNLQSSNPMQNPNSIITTANLQQPNNSMNPSSLSTNPGPSCGSSGTSSGGLIPNSSAGTSSSWAQAAGKSLQSTPGNASIQQQQPQPCIGSNNPGLPINPGPIVGAPSTGGATGGTVGVTSKQIEQLNTMREALFSHDGWGGQNVNQDSGWDIPGSPEPHHKEIAGISAGGAAAANASSTNGSGWKASNVNNGTDLWEANLRSGGVPQQQQPVQQKVPWGHTPTTNHGGTWGEEDDGGDSSNVWREVPQQQQQNTPTGPGPIPQQQPNPISNINSGQGQWGGGMNAPQQQPPQSNPRDQQQNQMWPQQPNIKKEPDWNNGRDQQQQQNWPDRTNNGRGMNMPVDPMWNKPQQPQQHQQHPQQQQQWGGAGGGGGPPQVGPVGHGMKDKQSGWDDISPPAQRRVVPNLQNYDDGTSLWGNNSMPGGQQPQQQQQQPPQVQRMQPNRGMPNKMDQMGGGGWGHNNSGGGGAMPNRNGWSQDSQPEPSFNNAGGGGGWNTDDKSSWGNDQMQQHAASSWGGGGKPKTPTNGPSSGWGDDNNIVDTTGWGGQSKNTKEDIEQLALRASSAMHLSDAIDTLDNLAGGRPMEQSPWGIQRNRDDHFDLNLGGPPIMGGMGGPPQQQQQQRGGGGFPGNQQGGGGNASGGFQPPLLNNLANPSLASINPSLLQKILTQQQQQQPNPQQQQQQSFNTGRVQQQNNNTTTPGQLRMLVQQIQMAVQAGYLSSQILQHPLPQQSLYLLNNLLQQIKIFQQLTQAQHQIGKTPNSNPTAALQLHVQITKTKQQITNLHNQIAAQQALHAKQQQQQQQQHQHLAVAAAAAAVAVNNQPQQNDFFLKNPHMMNQQNSGSGLMDPMISALQSNFGPEFGLNKESSSQQQQQQQQSRLTQWTKMPSIDKDIDVGDFSRAPGPQQHQGGNLINKNNTPSSSTTSLIGQSDNTWSTIPSGVGGVGRPSNTGINNDGWPTTTTNTTNHSPSSSGIIMTGNIMNDDKSSINNIDAWPSDLVPEFEPGKPWKGNQILKSIEDDPTLTPGSVVRSPLSLAIKDASEIFAKNVSPPTTSSNMNNSDSTPLSLSSSTWSFTPSAGGGGVSNNIQNSMTKLNATTKGGGVGWDDLARPWDYGNNGMSSSSSSRPPPGLPGKKPTTNQQQQNNSFNSYRNVQQTNNTSWNSPPPHYWLLLRNLTPQIDGSTLRTLCLQHGPLQNFQLFLNHGIALVKYSTREEAPKAQNALNSCVLGNTTILAETASETDVHNLIQGLSGGGNSGSQTTSNNSGYSTSNTNTNKTGGSDNPWGVVLRGGGGGGDNSPLWGSSSPWGTSNMDGIPDRATPSSLNSLLPGDLLGGESA